jgi:hypothetical protein
MGQPPWAVIASSISFSMPFHNGDFGGRQAVKGVNHLVNLVSLHSTQYIRNIRRVIGYRPRPVAEATLLVYGLYPFI